MATNISVMTQDLNDKKDVLKTLGTEGRINQQTIRVIPFPHFNEDPNLPFGNLARVFQKIYNNFSSLFLSETDHYILTSSLNFLSRSLYGEILRHVIDTYQPNITISTQECFINTIYEIDKSVILIHKTNGSSRIKDLLYYLEQDLAIQEKKEIYSWLSVISMRLKYLTPLQKLSDLIYTLVKIGRMDFHVQYKTLKSLFQCSPSNRIIFLSQTIPQNDFDTNHTHPFKHAIRPNYLKVKNLVSQLKDHDSQLNIELYKQNFPIEKQSLISRIINDNSSHLEEKQIMIHSESQKYLI